MTTSPARRVWIVGARGFLGAALRGLFRQALAIDPGCGDAGEGIAACVQEPGVIDRALRATGEPELVYFCAATRGGDAAAYRRAYLEPVQAVAAAVPGARLVFCSSAAVYEGQGAVTEDTPTPGGSEKLRLLLQAEQAALAAGGVVARLAPLYGGARCELLRRHLAGEPRLPGPPERMLNYLHVESAAEALRLLGTVRELSHRVYNVSDESFTQAYAYALLEELTGIAAAREVSPAGRRGASDHRIVAERIRELYEPQSRFAAYVKERVCGKSPT